MHNSRYTRSAGASHHTWSENTAAMDILGMSDDALRRVQERNAAMQFSAVDLDMLERMVLESNQRGVDGMVEHVRGVLREQVRRSMHGGQGKRQRSSQIAPCLPLAERCANAAQGGAAAGSGDACAAHCAR